MKALDILAQERAVDGEVSYSKTIALTFQPQSYSDFNRHPEFEEVFRRWTQNDKNRGLDFARIWGMALNCKQALQRGAGSIAELGSIKVRAPPCSAFMLSSIPEKYTFVTRSLDFPSSSWI